MPAAGSDERLQAADQHSLPVACGLRRGSTSEAHHACLSRALFRYRIRHNGEAVSSSLALQLGDARGTRTHQYAPPSFIQRRRGLSCGSGRIQLSL